MSQYEQRKLKPYTLVRVHKEGYAYVGELMSFPTPEQTIIVRRVPGCPETIEELGINTIELRPELLQKRRRWVHYATVSGIGSFPVDMLRYDVASPFNFNLVRTANGFRATHADPSYGTDDELTVAHVSDRPQPSWTYARWSSFQWTARHLRTESLERQG